MTALLSIALPRLLMLAASLIGAGVLFSSCSASGKYSPDRGPLVNDYEATALVLRWGYKHNKDLGKVVGYRSTEDAVYLDLQSPEGRIYKFRVNRNPKKAKLLSETVPRRL